MLFDHNEYCLLPILLDRQPRDLEQVQAAEFRLPRDEA